MDPLTKATVIIWASEEDANYLPISEERHTKIIQMTLDGKTNGDVYQVDPTTYVRDFTTQAAAQEFIDFILALASSQGKTIVSHSITDK